MPPLLVIVAIVAIAVVLSSSSGGSDPLMAYPAGWTANRTARAAEVWAVCASRGYGSNVAMSLVANAYGETRIGDYDGGDGGNSWGIYQLNRAAGLGRGLTVEECQDIETATGVMLDECERLGWGDLDPHAATAAELTEWICIYVERPANSATRAAERVGYLRNLYPDAD